MEVQPDQLDEGTVYRISKMNPNPELPNSYFGTFNSLIHDTDGFRVAKFLNVVFSYYVVPGAAIPYGFSSTVHMRDDNFEEDLFQFYNVDQDTFGRYNTAVTKALVRRIHNSMTRASGKSGGSKRRATKKWSKRSSNQKKNRFFTG